MANIIQRPTSLAMIILEKYISEGDVLIDATCGNGNDTLQLANLKPSLLYAFDIQETAIEATKSLLVSHGYGDNIKNQSIKLIQTSHINIPFYTKRGVTAIVFNLGYLPGGDKSITTTAQSTVKAVKSCLNLLKKDGIICITMYSGHRDGKSEKDILLSLAGTLDPSIYHVAYFGLINQPYNPPELLLITRK